MVVLLRQAPAPDEDPIQQAAAAGLDQDNEGVLASVGRFLSRPGYMLRSALRGDVVGALGNAAQFAFDLPTGGWLNHNWSLANLFTDTGDVTSKEQRPEFTDLLVSAGIGKTGNGIADAALDIVGGLATDPLTYLPFAGAAKAGLGAVSGTARGLAGARVVSALGETAKGAELAAQAGREVVAELAAQAAATRGGGAFSRLRDMGARMTPEWLASKEATVALGGPQRASALRRAVETKTAERVMRRAVATSPDGAALGAKAFRETAETGFVDALAKAKALPNAPPVMPDVEAAWRAFVAAPVKPAAEMAAYQQANPELWANARMAAQRATGFDEAGAFMRFGTTAEGGPAINAGLRALEEGGSTVPSGALTFRIPFDSRPIGAPGVFAPRLLTRGGAFGKAATALIPGKLLTDVAMVGSFGPVSRVTVDMRRLVDDRLARLSTWATSNLYDKTLASGAEKELLGDAATDAHVQAAHVEAGILATGGKGMAAALHGFDVPQVNAIGKVVIAANDHMEAIRQAGAHVGELGAIRRTLDAAISALPGGGVVGAAEPVALVRPPGADAAAEAAKFMRFAAQAPTPAQAASAAEFARRAMIPRLPEALTRGYSPEQRELMGKLALLMQEQAVHDAGLVGASREAVTRALGAYVKHMGEIADDLVRIGVWDAKAPNPFYAMTQAKEDVARFLSIKPSKKLGQAMLDVYAQRKTYRTSAEFEEKMREVAAAYGLNTPEGVQETNFAELWARRLGAHADTVGRVTLQDTLRKRFPGVRYASVVESYLARQFSEVGARKNWLFKLVGGGEMLTKLRATRLDEGDAAEAVAAGFKVVPHPDGGLAISKKWEGLNFYAKPALTIAFPGFYARNVVSMLVSVAIDPSMGAPIAKQVLASLADAPILRALTGRGRQTKQVAALIARAVRDPDSLTKEQNAILAASTVGKHSALDVVRMARDGVARKSFPDAEVFEASGKLNNVLAALSPGDARTFERVLQGKDLVSAHDDLWHRMDQAYTMGEVGSALGTAPGTLRRAAGAAWSPGAPAVAQNVLGRPGAMAQSFRNQVARPLGALNSWIEDSARVGSFVKLVEGGMDPIRAQKRVDAVFVNYATQSATERGVRDLIPFARYSIGSVPVTIRNVLQRPGHPVYSAVRTLVNRQPAGQFLPENLKGQTALQVGTDKDGNPIYAGSLGLPFEPAAAALALVGRPFSGGIRQGLAQVQPQIRAAAEAAIGRSFYFGNDPMAYRDAPRILPDALTTVTQLPGGRTTRTVPGWVNHWLLGATPLSRFNSEINKLLDERLDPSARAFDFLSGARLQSVDQRAQAKRAIMRWLEEAEARGEVRQVEAFFQTGTGDARLKAALAALATIHRQNKALATGRSAPQPGVR